MVTTRRRTEITHPVRTKKGRKTNVVSQEEEREEENIDHEYDDENINHEEVGEDEAAENEVIRPIASRRVVVRRIMNNPRRNKVLKKKKNINMDAEYDKLNQLDIGKLLTNSLESLLKKKIGLSLIAPRYSKLDLKEWGKFVKEYKEYTARGGEKNIGQCIDFKIVNKFKYWLPQEYYNTPFINISNEVFFAITKPAVAKDILIQRLMEQKMGLKEDLNCDTFFAYVDRFNDIIVEYPDELKLKKIITLFAQGCTVDMRLKYNLLAEIDCEEFESWSKFLEFAITTATNLIEQFEYNNEVAVSDRKKSLLNQPREKIYKRNFKKEDVKEEVKEDLIQDKVKASTGTDNSKKFFIRSCFNCGESGHLAKECRKTRDDSKIQKKFDEIKAKSTKMGAISFRDNSKNGEINSENIIVNKTSALLWGEIEGFKSRLTVLMDSGADVAVISPKISDQLVELGYKIHDCNVWSTVPGELTHFNKKFKNISVKMELRDGPHTILINPYVAESGRDIIVDRDTSIACGAISINFNGIDPNIGDSFMVGSISLANEIEEIIKSSDTLNELDETDFGPVDSKFDIRINGIPDGVIGDIVSKESMENILFKYPSVFDVSTLNINVDKLEKFKIQLKSDPKFDNPRNLRTSIADKAIIDGIIAKYKEDGLIRDSDSNVASNIVLVKAKNKDPRLCVDYRHINRNTEAMRYPCRNLMTVVEFCKNKSFLSKIDLYKGYHQIGMDYESIKLTAFVTPSGLFEFVRMPFGFMNAPCHFQKCMDKVLDGLMDKVCQGYIDDVVIAADSEEEMLLFVDLVLKRLDDFGLKIKMSKCMFGFAEIPLLGFLVSGSGYRMDPKRVEAIAEMQFPKSAKHMKSFLGLVNYFHTFIDKLANDCKPLYGLCNEKKYFPTEDNIKAFENIKKKIIDVTALEFINPDFPLIIRSDASDYAVGGVLLQNYEGRDHFIGFYSRALSKAELNWSTIEKEGFAIFMCIKRFSSYISGHRVELQTDHRNLLFMFKSEVPKIQRWRSRILEFDINLSHINGRDNVIADTLSRVGIGSVLIETDVEDIVRRFHNSTLGHNGVDETMRKIKDAGYEWPGMRKDIADYIKACDCCQKNGPFQSPKLKSYSVTVTEPFKRIAIDFVGPLRPDLNGNTFILVAVDSFTRWVELFPLPFARTEFVAEALLRMCCRYGIFDEILSDNGPQFVSETLETFMGYFDINHLFSSPYHHEGNGQVESINREVMQCLRSIIYDDNFYNNWSFVLPRVQFILNSRVSSATGCAPMNMLYGNAISLNRGLPEYNMEKETFMKLDEYLRGLIENQELMMKKAREIDGLKLKKKEIYNESIVEDVFYPNEYVLVNIGEKNNDKLLTRSKGPYKVVERDLNTYLLRDLKNEKVIRMNALFIKRFIVRDKNIEELKAIVAKDFAEFIVSNIKKHRWSKDLKCWEFLVVWRDLSEPSWEPIANLKNNIILFDYIKRNKLDINLSI